MAEAAPQTRMGDQESTTCRTGSMAEAKDPRGKSLRCCGRHHRHTAMVYMWIRRKLKQNGWQYQRSCRDLED